ncbi:MAG: hypothetical protein A3E85_04190 [Gammaproteobacteria bacterium RIFCSPHIGHO2_12_FULL_45_12]|nr:MAG: hypothetical protein A3E85_04190 [Gammaproteobacteria bacterium RIFCSPHIGHO2_12_FULL_45_12]
MTTISIRLPDKLLHEMDHHAHAANMARAEYVRLAIELMNAEINKKARSNRLKKISLKVRKESMLVNKEFSDIEHDPEN